MLRYALICEKNAACFGELIATTNEQNKLRPALAMHLNSQSFLALHTASITQSNKV